MDATDTKNIRSTWIAQKGRRAERYCLEWLRVGIKHRDGWDPSPGTEQYRYVIRFHGIRGRAIGRTLISSDDKAGALQVGPRQSGGIEGASVPRICRQSFAYSYPDRFPLGISAEEFYQMPSIPLVSMIEMWVPKDELDAPYERARSVTERVIQPDVARTRYIYYRLFSDGRDITEKSFLVATKDARGVPFEFLDANGLDTPISRAWLKRLHCPRSTTSRHSFRPWMSLLGRSTSSGAAASRPLSRTMLQQLAVHLPALLCWSGGHHCLLRTTLPLDPSLALMLAQAPDLSFAETQSSRKAHWHFLQLMLSNSARHIVHPKRSNSGASRHSSSVSMVVGAPLKKVGACAATHVARWWSQARPKVPEAAPHLPGHAQPGPGYQP